MDISIDQNPSRGEPDIMKYSVNKHNSQKPIKETEKIMILQALETTNGNKRKAAHIPRSIFYNKLKEYRIGL